MFLFQKEKKKESENAKIDAQEQETKIIMKREIMKLHDNIENLSNLDPKRSEKLDQTKYQRGKLRR